MSPRLHFVTCIALTVVVAPHKFFKASCAFLAPPTSLLASSTCDMLVASHIHVTLTPCFWEMGLDPLPLYAIRPHQAIITMCTVHFLALCAEPGYQQTMRNREGLSETSRATNVYFTNSEKKGLQISCKTFFHAPRGELKSFVQCGNIFVPNHEFAPTRLVSHLACTSLQWQNVVGLVHK